VSRVALAVIALSLLGVGCARSESERASEPFLLSAAPFDFAGGPTSVAVGEGAVWVTTAAGRRPRDRLPGSSGARTELDTRTRMLVRIDPSTRRVTARTSTPDGASDLAVGEGSVWVRSAERRSIVRVDPRTGRLGPRIRTPFRSRLDVGFGKLWIARGAELVALDVRTGRRLGPGTRFSGVADVAVGEGAVWVVAGDPTRYREGDPGAALFRVDPRTQRITRRIRLSRYDASGVAVGGGGVWVSTLFGRHEVIRVDPRAGREVARIPVGGPDAQTLPSPERLRASVGAPIIAGRSDVDLAAGADGVWVTNEYDSTLRRIDPGTNHVTSVLRTSAGKTDLALGGGAAWLADAGSRTLLVAERTDRPQVRTRPRAAIDERRGAYLGVAVGDDRGRIAQALGDASPLPPGVPLRHGIRTPSFGYGVTTVAFDGFSYLLSGDRVVAILVSVPGARTGRGVRVGDPLSAVAKRHPGARCADGNADPKVEDEVGLFATGGPLGLEPFCAIDLGPCLRMEIAGRIVHTIAVFAPDGGDPGPCGFRPGRASR